MVNALSSPGVASLGLARQGNALNLENQGQRLLNQGQQIQNALGQAQLEALPEQQAQNREQNRVAIASQMQKLLSSANETQRKEIERIAGIQGRAALVAKQRGLNNQQFGQILEMVGVPDQNPDIDTALIVSEDVFGQFQQNQRVRPVEIQDPNRPGQTTFVRPAQAVGQAGPERQPLVSINNSQQTEEDKAFGKRLVTEFSNVSDRADQAEQEITTLRLMRNTAQQEGFRTGAVEPLRNTLAAVAKGLGVPLSDSRIQQVVDAQTFTALGGQLLANRLAAQKGPQTDQDAQRMLQTLASLDKEADANDFLLRSGIALRSREIEQRDFFRDWRADKGTLDGASQAWSRFKNEVPLFGISPNTGRPVFFTEFAEANEDKSMTDIVNAWTQTYGQ